MRNPEIFIAYAPRGAGLRCALAYLEDAHDVYGWFAGPRHDAGIARRYFVLENFHTTVRTRYQDVDQSDLHCAWPLAESCRRELAEMQEAFEHEWLFCRNEPRATAELLAYCAAGRAAGELDLRFEKFARLRKRQPTWTYSSTRFNDRVLRALSRCWPLGYRPRVGGMGGAMLDRLRAHPWGSGPRP